VCRAVGGAARLSLRSRPAAIGLLDGAGEQARPEAMREGDANPKSGRGSGCRVDVNQDILEIHGQILHHHVTNMIVTEAAI
jgi:hypothetical protein